MRSAVRSMVDEEDSALLMFAVEWDTAVTTTRGLGVLLFCASCWAGCPLSLTLGLGKRDLCLSLEKVYISVRMLQVMLRAWD